MDAVKGIHAGATSFFAFFIAYVGYDFINNFFSSITEDTLKYIFWGTYILVLLVSTLGIPAIIAFGEDNDASLISMVAGLGFYFSGVLFIRIFYPVMQIFVGDGGALSGILSDEFHIQIMSFLVLLGILFALIIGPIVVGTLPEYVNERRAKEAKELME